jgi:hypothetical protein
VKGRGMEAEGNRRNLEAGICAENRKKELDGRDF